MGGGDLNLKKSWHTGLIKNQAAVWKREQEALDERKRILERQKEIQEERERNELLAMQDASGGRKRVDRVDWMYNAPQSGSLGTTEEAEAYLLGRKRIDDVLIGNDSEKLKKDSGVDTCLQKDDSSRLTSSRDIAAKVRQDPMLAIKQQEQAAMEAAVRRQRLNGSRSGRDRTFRREESHRDRSERRRRHHRSSSTSPDRRHRSSGRSRSERDYSRHQTGDGYRGNQNDSDHFRRYSSRSRSPESRKDYEYKSRRSRYDDSEEEYPRRRQYTEERSYNNNRNSSRLPARSEKDDERERAKRLAEMQSNANELQNERIQRLERAKEEEDKARREDEDARKKAAKYGGQGEFIRKVNSQRFSGSIDRLRSGRGAVTSTANS